MKNNFEVLISSLLDNKIGFSNQFLSDSLANDLKINLLSLCYNQKFKSAGIGNTENLIQNKNIRSDEIYWLDRKHENQSQNDFLDLMEMKINNNKLNYITPKIIEFKNLKSLEFKNNNLTEFLEDINFDFLAVNENKKNVEKEKINIEEEEHESRPYLNRPRLSASAWSTRHCEVSQ